MCNYYIYVHRKATTGEIFYVGKGKDKRAWSHSGRTDFWKRVVSKHGLIVEIHTYGIQEWYAFELESELIALYGRLDTKTGCLVNMCDGGEGPSGVIQSDATRKKISDARKGIKFSEDHRRKISQKRKGSSLTEATKSKMSMARKGKAHHEQWRNNLARSIKKRFAKAVERNDGVVYDSIIDAAKSVCIDDSKLQSIATAIGAYARGKRKSLAYGYAWRFVSEQIQEVSPC